jgi:hypothetical protein
MKNEVCEKINSLKTEILEINEKARIKKIFHIEYSKELESKESFKAFGYEWFLIVSFII